MVVVEYSIFVAPIESGDTEVLEMKVSIECNPVHWQSSLLLLLVT